jgi:hypothetical protein
MAVWQKALKLPKKSENHIKLAMFFAETREEQIH